MAIAEMPCADIPRELASEAANLRGNPHWNQCLVGELEIWQIRTDGRLEWPITFICSLIDCCLCCWAAPILNEWVEWLGHLNLWWRADWMVKTGLGICLEIRSWNLKWKSSDLSFLNWFVFLRLMKKRIVPWSNICRSEMQGCAVHSNKPWHHATTANMIPGDIIVQNGAYTVITKLERALSLSNGWRTLLASGSNQVEMAERDWQKTGFSSLFVLNDHRVAFSCGNTLGLSNNEWNTS